MKTPILVGLFAAISLGAAETSAGKKDTPSEPSADSNTPKSIACAQETGEALGQCSYRIEQNKTGKITVTVVFANGFKRRLFFKDGAFLKANATMSGTGTDTAWSLKDGMHKVRVDDQRYELPDTLIAGD